MCQTLSSGEKELSKTEKFWLSSSIWKRQNKHSDKYVNTSDMAKRYKAN